MDRNNSMNCPRCANQMVEGCCYPGQTGLGFLFAGISLPHLFFESARQKRQSITSWNEGACRAFRCEACEAVLVYPDEQEPS